MENETIVTVVYDGHCRLCGWSVGWLFAKIPPEKIRFVPTQSDEGASIMARAGMNVLDPQTVIVVYESQLLTKGSAMRFLLKMAGGVGKPIAYVLGIIPSCLLDMLYLAVASRRYALFGKLNSCFIPGSESSKNREPSTQ